MASSYRSSMRRLQFAPYLIAPNRSSCTDNLLPKLKLYTSIEASNLNVNEESENCVRPNLSPYRRSRLKKADSTTCWSYADAVGRTEKCNFDREQMAIICVALRSKYRLPDVATNAIVQFVKRCMPNNNLAPKSFYVCKKIVEKLSNKCIGDVCFKIHKICHTCDRPLITNVCANVACNRTLKKPSEYFSCSLKTQLQGVVDKYGSLILKHLKKQSHLFQSGTYNDIASSKRYNELGANPTKKKELWINLVVSADGARLVNTRTGSLWPCNALIAELPAKIRCSFHNVVSVGFWFGEKKPVWEVFLQNLEFQIDKINDSNLQVLIDCEMYTIKVRIIAAVFDLQARCSIWNMVAHNGRFPCMDCQHPGDTLRRGKRYFTYEMFDPKTEELYDNCYTAFELQPDSTPIFGVKGPSVLCPLIKPHNSTNIDYMHHMYHGVFSQLTSALFVTKLPDLVTYSWWNGTFDNKLNMDALARNIIWPHDMKRKLTTFQNQSETKAATQKNLLLYAILPLLKPTLNVEDLEFETFWHWLAILVEIARTVNQENVNEMQLEVVDRLVQIFLTSFEEIMGSSALTLNVHNMQHITKYVRLFGPVQNLSTFVFEGLIYVYSRLPSAAFGTMHQIRRRFATQRYIDWWIKNGILCENNAEFLQNMFVSKEKKVENIHGIKVFLPKMYNPLPADETVLIDNAAFWVKRIKCHGLMLHSEAFCKTETSSSHLVRLHDGSYCSILKFVVDTENQLMVIARKFHVISSITDDVDPPKEPFFSILNENLYGNYHHKVQISETKIAFPTSQIENKCIWIPVNGENYITSLANLYEHD